MYKIKKGFINVNGKEYSNIRNISFDNIKELNGNLGIFKVETFCSNNDLFGSSFNQQNGVYIYQTYYDKSKALRIYKDFADYRYIFYDDDKLISILQERQKDVVLTNFPTGIVSIENKIIGQEIPYYENSVTLLEYVLNNQNNLDIKYIYISILNILKELVNNGIIYKDIHSKNFMIDQASKAIKLIDFESRFIDIDPVEKSSYEGMIRNLISLLSTFNRYLKVDFKTNFSNTSTLSDIEESILENKYLVNKRK